jgi:hypothetical protein
VFHPEAICTKVIRSLSGLWSSRFFKAGPSPSVSDRIESHLVRVSPPLRWSRLGRQAEMFGSAGQHHS